MSTSTFTLTINGERVGVDAVWAHLKKPADKEYPIYHLSVPYAIAPIVFGAEKPEALSWAVHVFQTINEFGTFMVDGYIANLTRFAETKRGPFEWVIITVDQVREEGDLLGLAGRAERFKRELGIPRLKRLE
jgi:hypothetical protein